MVLEYYYCNTSVLPPKVGAATASVSERYEFPAVTGGGDNVSVNEKHRYIITHNAVNALIVIGFVAVGWMSRGVLEKLSEDWKSFQFTMQLVVPLLVVAIFVATLHFWMKPLWARILTVLVVLGALLGWYNSLTEPLNYQWSSGLVAIGLLLVMLVGGMSILAWLKPHMAAWPWWK